MICCFHNTNMSVTQEYRMGGEAFGSCLASLDTDWGLSLERSHLKLSEKLPLGEASPGSSQERQKVGR